MEETLAASRLLRIVDRADVWVLAGFSLSSFRGDATEFVGYVSSRSRPRALDGPYW